eukprot:TCONS_00048378-protein
MADYTDDMHIKMCKKIAQLTKVIYNLNSRAEESDTIIANMKKEYKANITRIMEESKNQIFSCKAKYQEYENFEKQLKKSTDVLKETEEQNLRLQKILEETVERSKLNENSLRTDYENKLLDLQNKLLERKREYGELLDRFSSFQKDLDASKRGKISEVNNQHEQIAVMKEKFEKEVLRNKEKQNELRDTIESIRAEYEIDRKNWFGEKDQILIENEDKILKLKQLHARELASLGGQIKTNEFEKLENEKQKLIKDFELRKTEFINRIRFLEKSLSQNEEENEEMKASNTNLQTQVIHFEKTLASVNSELKEKIVHLERIESERRRNTDDFSKQISNLDQMKTQQEASLVKLKSKLDSQANKLNETKFHKMELEKQCSLLEKEVVTWKDKFDNEHNRYQMNQNDIENQFNTVNNLQLEIQKLQSKIKILEDKSQTDLKTLQQKQTSEQAKEQKKHTQDISRFKEESERILKETQSLLLEQFEKDKQAIKLEFDTKINDLNSQLKVLEENLSSKAKEVDHQNKTLSTVNSKLHDSNRQLVELQKQYKDQKSMLGSAMEKNNDYKKLLADTQSGASNEKEQFLMEQKHKEQEFQQRIERIKELMRKESSENIRNLTEAHQKELSEKITQHNLIIEKMRLESEQTRQHKENEILLLQNDLKMLSEKQDRNRESLSSQHLTHQQEITDLKKAFEQQKEEMLNDFERQLSTLKDTSVEEMTRKEDGWHEMMKQEMSTISADHQRELEELHKSNQLLLTSLKSQLVAEQKAESEELKRNFAIEKEKLQNVLQIQHEERLKQIMKDFEKEITTQKDELSTSKDLRQKEVCFLSILQFIFSIFLSTKILRFGQS